jgi:hypothetical protein
MNSFDNLKIRWTWDEWKNGRAELKALTDRVTPLPIRRAKSSSDKRLRSLFSGERFPRFTEPSKPSR